MHSDGIRSTPDVVPPMDEASAMSKKPGRGVNTRGAGRGRGQNSESASASGDLEQPSCETSSFLEVEILKYITSHSGDGTTFPGKKELLAGTSRD